MLVYHIRAVVPPTDEVEQSMLGDLQLRGENQLERCQPSGSSSRPCVFPTLSFIVIAKASERPC